MPQVIDVTNYNNPMRKFVESFGQGFNNALMYNRLLAEVDARKRGMTVDQAKAVDNAAKNPVNKKSEGWAQGVTSAAESGGKDPTAQWVLNQEQEYIKNTLPPDLLKTNELHLLAMTPWNTQTAPLLGKIINDQQVGVTGKQAALDILKQGANSPYYRYEQPRAMADNVLNAIKSLGLKFY